MTHHRHHQSRKLNFGLELLHCSPASAQSLPGRPVFDSSCFLDIFNSDCYNRSTSSKLPTHSQLPREADNTANMTNMEPSITAEHYNNKEQQITHVENGQQSDDERKSVEDDPLTYFTPAEQKKIIHRLDRRLVTVVGVMYCVSLMDRSNLSNAAIAGMNAELELTVGMRYVSIAGCWSWLHPLRYVS